MCIQCKTALYRTQRMLSNSLSDRYKENGYLEITVMHYTYHDESMFLPLQPFCWSVCRVTARFHFSSPRAIHLHVVTYVFTKSIFLISSIPGLLSIHFVLSTTCYLLLICDQYFINYFITVLSAVHSKYIYYLNFAFLYFLQFNLFLSMPKSSVK